MQLGLLKYDVKVLLALQQAFTGKDDFFNWLVNAGYPELAAFCNFIQEDEDAEAWLVKHGYHWLGLLSHAIDGEDAARAWGAVHPQFRRTLGRCGGLRIRPFRRQTV